MDKTFKVIEGEREFNGAIEVDDKKYLIKISLNLHRTAIVLIREMKSEFSVSVIKYIRDKFIGDQECIWFLDRDDHFLSVDPETMNLYRCAKFNF
jgi:hypothetical protein